MTDPANSADQPDQTDQTNQPDRTDIDRTQRLLGERYQLSWIIGRGGMSTVWLARDTQQHRDVAVKILKPEYTENQEFRARFQLEAESAQHFKSQNVVATYDYGEVTDHGAVFCYIIMEYVQGETLADVLQREHTLPENMAMDLLGQTALGLATIHEAGMVHRDIKPGNLLITAEGIVKITDFGIAKAAAAVPLTQTGMVVGTAQYVSPEQAQGHNVTAASDIYSLGVVAYEVLSGRRPFRGESTVSVAIKHISEKPDPLSEEISPEVRKLVGICLRKKPETRYADGKELAQAAALVEEGKPAPRPHLLPPVAGGQPLTDHFAQANDAANLSEVATGTGTAVPPRQGPRNPAGAPGARPNAARSNVPASAAPAARSGAPATPPPSSAHPSNNAANGKSSRGLWIALAVLVILAAGLAGYLLVSGNNDTSPDKETLTVTNEVTTEHTPTDDSDDVTIIEPREPRTEPNDDPRRTQRERPDNDRDRDNDRDEDSQPSRSQSNDRGPTDGATSGNNHNPTTGNNNSGGNDGGNHGDGDGNGSGQESTGGTSNPDSTSPGTGDNNSQASESTSGATSATNSEPTQTRSAGQPQANRVLAGGTVQ